MASGKIKSGRIGPVQIVFNAPTTTVEPDNCTYTVDNGIAIVNVAGVYNTNNGYTEISYGIPEPASRANLTFLNGTILYVDVGSSILKLTGKVDNAYGQLCYPTEETR